MLLLPVLLSGTKLMSSELNVFLLNRVMVLWLSRALVTCVATRRLLSWPLFLMTELTSRLRRQQSPVELKFLKTALRLNALCLLHMLTMLLNGIVTFLTACLLLLLPEWVSSCFPNLTLRSTACTSSRPYAPA